MKYLAVAMTILLAASESPALADPVPTDGIDVLATTMPGLEEPAFDAVPQGYIAESFEQRDIIATDSTVLDSTTGLSLKASNGASEAIYTRETRFGTQTIFQIDDPTQNSFEFEVALADGHALEIQQLSNGSLLLSENGDFVAGVNTPWAFDATGAAVPTHFEIVDGVIKQIVVMDATTAYPVTADPSLSTVVGCIAALGFATAAAVATGGVASEADVVSLALCIQAMDSDRAAVAKDRATLATVKAQLSTVQSEIARLQSANAEFTRVLNDPKSSASAKTYARNQIAANNSVIAADQKLAAAYQAHIDSLYAHISDLSYWP